MKYHSNVSTIFISLLVVTIFVVVAVLWCVTLQIGSPGRLLSTRIENQLAHLSPAYHFSFSHMDRLIKDKVTVHDAVFSYHETEILTIKELTINDNPFDLAKDYLLHQGKIPLLVTDAVLNIPEDLSFLKQNKDPSTVEKKADDEGGLLSSLSFLVSFDNLSVSYKDIVVEKIKGEVSVSRDLHLDKAEVSIPSFSYANTQFSVQSKTIKALLKYGNGYRLTATAGLSKGSMKGYEASISSVFGRAEFKDLGLDELKAADIRLLLGKTQVTSSNQELSISLSTIEGATDGNLIKAEGKDASALIKGYAIASGDVTASYFLKDKSFTLALPQSTTLIRNEILLAQAEDMKFSGKLGNPLFFVLDMASVDSSMSKADSRDLINLIALSKSHVFARYDQVNGLFFEGESTFDATSGDSLINGIAAPIAFSGSYLDGKGFQSFELSVPALFTLENGDSLSLDALYGKNEGLSITSTLGKELAFNYRNKGKDLSLHLNSEAFALKPFKGIITSFLPQFEKYIGDATQISGNLNVQSKNEDSVRRDVHGALAISGITFNRLLLSAATSIDATYDGKGASVQNLTLSSQFLRLQYQGDISFETKLPEGQFDLSIPSSGKKIFSFEFALGSDKEYSFIGQIPMYQASYLAGSVNWRSADTLASVLTLKSGATVYPLDLNIDFSRKHIDFTSTGFVSSVDYQKELLINIAIDNLPLPVKEASIVPAKVNSEIHFKFDFPAQQLSLEAPVFRVDNMRHLPLSPSLSLSLYANNDKVEIPTISFFKDDSSFSGRGVYDIATRTGALSIGTDTERINLSLMPFEGILSGFITVDNFHLSRLGFSDGIMQLSLMGKGTNSQDFAFNGFLNVVSEDKKNNPFTFKTRLALKEQGFSLTDSAYINGALSLTSSSIGYYIDEGLLKGNLGLSYKIENYDRDYPITASLSFQSDLGIYQRLIDSVTGIFAKYKEGLDATLKLNSFILDNHYFILDRTIDVHKEGERLTLDGNLAKGWATLSDPNLSLSIIDNDLLECKIEGKYDPNELALGLSIGKLDLSMINLCLTSPAINFMEDAFVQGDFHIMGSLKDPHVYGTAYGHDVGMKYFWVDRQDVILHNPTFQVWDNEVKTNKTAATLVDRIDRSKKAAYATIECELGANVLEYYQIDIDAIPGQSVHVRIPVISQNLDMAAWVTGHFRLYSDLKKIENSGTLLLNDGVFSIGMNPMPEWWHNSQYDVKNEYDVTLGKNIRFLMPLSDNPIISANIKEGTKFHFLYDSETHEVLLDGDLTFRSGEIFYFQKNFYITEGSIHFTHPSSGEKRLEPHINLKAKFTDYDSNNEKVDVFLELHNATMDSLNPTFSSSPYRDITQIMSILGSAILPTNAYGEANVSSIASLVSSSVDIMSRLGVLPQQQSTGLTDSIRSSLGLDLFSLHTNIFENILLDSIQVNREGETYHRPSPLARYLNDTSIYFGKYLSDDFFFQGSIHFESLQNTKNFENKTFMLAGDLALDIDFSLEWTNPLGSIAIFTQPTNFTIYDIMGNLGLRYSHRITY